MEASDRIWSDESDRRFQQFPERGSVAEGGRRLARRLALYIGQWLPRRWTTSLPQFDAFHSKSASG